MICIAFCVVAGLASFRRIPNALRLLVIQALCAFSVDFTGFLIRQFGSSTNNHILFNIYIPIDFLLMLFATRMMLGRQFWMIGGGGIGAVFAAWIYSIVRTGPHVFANQAMIVSAIVLMIAYFLVLLRQVQLERSEQTYGIYCIAISVMLFYCCIIPNMGFMHYITRLDMDLASRLTNITHVVSSLRYILTGIGLFLIARSSKTPIHAYK